MAIFVLLIHNVHVFFFFNLRQEIFMSKWIWAYASSVLQKMWKLNMQNVFRCFQFSEIYLTI